MTKVHKLLLGLVFALGQAVFLTGLFAAGHFFYPLNSQVQVPWTSRVAGLVVLAGMWGASVVASAWLCRLAYVRVSQWRKRSA